jgi:hypothetical protein
MPKAIRFNQPGGPEVLHIEDQPERQPGPGEVRLKVEAVGLNRAESMYYHGSYMEKVNVPSGLGYEGFGRLSPLVLRFDPTLTGKRFGTIPGFSSTRYLRKKLSFPPAFSQPFQTPSPPSRAPLSGCSIVPPTARS